MEKTILDKAKELLADPDIIIDLYDFTIVWSSQKHEKITGFSKKELTGKQVQNFFALNGDKKRAKAIEHMSKSHGRMNVESTTKKGYVVKFTVEFYTIKFDDGFYHIGKLLDYKKIPK